MKVLITGESHIGAIAKGLDLLRERGEIPPEYDIFIKPLGGGHLLPTPFFVDEGTHARLTEPTYIANFQTLPPKSQQHDWYGFCAPLHTARVYRHEDWKQYSTLAMPPATIPLSASAFRRVVLDDQKYVLQLLDLLLRNKKKVFAIEAPYPFQRHYHVANIGAEKLLRINSDFRAIMLAELQHRHIPVIRVPAECIGADGFMLDAFHCGTPDDQHHASAEFGAKMMRQIIELTAAGA